MDILNYILACSEGDTTEVSNVRTENGVEIHTFEKELIHVGSFVKPSDDVSFEIKDETLDHFITMFTEMRVNGVEIPLPKTHKVSDNPDDSHGFLRGLRKQNGKLIGKIEIIGSDAPEVAKKSNVSIYVPSTWTDGRGHTYERPIQHVALTTRPVIPGMEEFKPLAASMLVLAEETNTMDWTKIAKALGITDLKDDTAEAQVLEAIQKMQTKSITDLKASNDALTALKLSMSSDGKVDPVLVNLSADNRSMKLTALFEAGKVSPVVREAMEKRFIGEGQHEVLALSLGRGGDDFDFIVGILSTNEVKKTGEKTGGQTLELADQLKADENVLERDADKRVKEAS